MAASAPNRGRFVFLTDTLATVPGRFGWRLDAANNRPLGRGVGTFATLEECADRLGVLRGDLAAGVLVDAVSFDSARGLWTWRLTRDEHLCAVAVRTYLRRFECRRAVAHFRQALGDVPPSDGVVRVVRSEALDRYDLGEPAGRPAATS